MNCPSHLAVAVSFAIMALSTLPSCRDDYVFTLADNIGVCTSVDNAETVKAAGGAYVEIGAAGFLVPEQPDSAFSANRQKALDSALPLLCSNGFFPGDKILLTGPDADIEKAVEYATVAIQRAKAIGIKTMVLGSGRARNIPEGFSRAEADAQFAEICRRIGDVAQENGIVVVLEPLRSEETNYLNSVREASALARVIGHPAIKVLADFYHMIQEGEDAQAIIEAGDLLYHCHIAEGAERTRPGVAGDDFTPYFRALKEIKYTGRISIECWWSDFNSEVGPAIAEMKRQLLSIND